MQTLITLKSRAHSAPLLASLELPKNRKILKKKNGFQLIMGKGSSSCFLLNPSLLYFYNDEKLSADGFPLAGALHKDESFRGTGPLSCFDVTLNGLNQGIVIDPSPNGAWQLARAGGRICLTIDSDKLSLRSYQGHEPDWKIHPFPFRNIPFTKDPLRHAMIRGLLDFFGGTRGAMGSATVFQKPNTNSGYGLDGIPDTYFQFLGAYPYISDLRRSYLESHLEWLGSHIRADGCIPWGGVPSGKPYYHLWISEKCGLFFDGNALWLDMVYRVWLETGRLPETDKIIRACDFYLHYMTPDGLVAAESKMRGCEWADLLQNGWHSSLINVLAVRAFQVTEAMLRAARHHELADRYRGAGQRLRNRLNQSIQQGGLWNGNGYVDWRDPKGGLHPHYRLDTHALAILFDVPEPWQMKKILQTLREHPLPAKVPPAPYLLMGNWREPQNDMLDDCTSWDFGRATMCGRCGATLVAALRRLGEKKWSQTLESKLVDMIVHERGVPEYYMPDGTPMRAVSYIEHALSIGIAATLIHDRPIDAKHKMIEK
ncbi:MAG: hypothetical protein PHV34_24805 [Verrucomicrobiae bacterium]|nr:hypothetical protein [Verrucomicrobiae bacterium]